jgi:hypothetical protein
MAIKETPFTYSPSPIIHDGDLFPPVTNPQQLSMPYLMAGEHYSAARKFEEKAEEYRLLYEAFTMTDVVLASFYEGRWQVALEVAQTIKNLTR